MNCSSFFLRRSMGVAGVLVFVAGGAYAQFFDFVSAARWGGDQTITSKSGRVLQDGNLYAIGEYEADSDIDPGPDVLTPPPINLWNWYLLKIDPFESLVYAATFHSDTHSSTVAPSGVTPSGRLLLWGSFGGTFDIDPGPGTFEVTCPDSNCMLVMALNSLGEFEYGLTLNSVQNPLTVLQSHVDSSGNHFIAGRFRGTVDFDPGPGVFELSSQGILPFTDGFILKLDTDGNFLFARSFGGIDSAVNPDSLTTDASNGIHVGGSFSGTVDFDPGPAVVEITEEHTAGFALKLDAAGDFEYVRHNSNNGLGRDRVNSIGVDSTGAAYLTGTFSGEVDFDPGLSGFARLSNGGDDGFVQKIGPGGDLIWLRTFGAGESDIFDGGEYVDSFDNLYISAGFEGFVDFDPGPRTRVVASGGSPPGTAHSDALVVLSSSGDLRNVTMFRGDSSVGIGQVGAGNPGQLRAHGTFDGTVDFDPGPDEYLFTSLGFSFDPYVVTIERNNAVFVDAPGVIAEGNTVALHAPIGENFQWLKDGVPVVDDPPRVTGATTYTFVLEPVLESDAGTYRMQYENGAKAVVVSEPYVFMVNPPGALPLGRTVVAILGLLLGATGILTRSRRRLRV